MGDKVYTLLVTIEAGYMTSEFVESNPVVSRTIEIRGDQTLDELHDAIFAAHDRFDDSHLYEFHLGEQADGADTRRYVLPFAPAGPDASEVAGSVTETEVGQLGLQVGSALSYLFDFGDNWRHRIEVTSIGKPAADARYPRVVASVGASPPQYPDQNGADWADDGDDFEDD